MCNKRITQFYVPPTYYCIVYVVCDVCGCIRCVINLIITAFLPSRRASPPFGWYLAPVDKEGWPGRVNLGGCLHIEMNVPLRELKLDTVTHPSTNRARRRLTSIVDRDQHATPSPDHGRPRAWAKGDGVLPLEML